MKSLGWIQRLLLIFGLLLIGIYMAANIHGALISRAELQRFQHLRAETTGVGPETLLHQSGSKCDFRLWSEKRIAAYEESLAEHVDLPVAVLRISRVHLEVPVLEGTDDLSLNRGVGHIAGTGRPGDDGNVGIAGHRDGFFRGLKDVAPGDTIELLTARRTDRYLVDHISIVSPNDVSVLQPRPSRSTLTLVTCYPFYFVGSAPQRFIVQASIRDSHNTSTDGARESRLHSSEH
jgi:sortase A